MNSGIAIAFLCLLPRLVARSFLLDLLITFPSLGYISGKDISRVEAEAEATGGTRISFPGETTHIGG